LDATHEFEKRERETVQKFQRGWTSLLFSTKTYRGIHSIRISKDLIAFNPVLQRVKIPRGDRILQKSYVFPPFQKVAN
jgi:hypothetical protein